jgi:hypothetical protein
MSVGDGLAIAGSVQIPRLPRCRGETQLRGQGARSRDDPGSMESVFTPPRSTMIRRCRPACGSLSAWRMLEAAGEARFLPPTDRTTRLDRSMLRLLRRHRPARPGRALPRLGLIFIVATTAIAAAAAPDAFVLDLPDGGTLPGDFAASPAVADAARETFLWKGSAFVAPFEFRLDAVVGVRATAARAAAQNGEGFRVLLKGGDIIDGALEAIDAEHVVLVPAGGGDPVRIGRGIVTSVKLRAAGEGGGYVGPGGLAGWQQEPAASWREEAARLTCDRRNASVTRDVGGPPRARYDIVLSWREPPEVVVAVAAGDSKSPDPYRFELIEVAPGKRTGLIARQEVGGGSLEEVVLPPLAKGRLRLSLFVDIAAGRLAAVVDGSETIIDTMVEPKDKAEPPNRFRLTLLSGDVCLESLRVTEWTAADPVLAERPETTVSIRGGKTLTGTVETADGTGGVVIATATGPETIPLADLEAIEFAVAANAAADAAAGPAGDEPLPALRVVGHSGGVLTGNLVSIADGRLGISHRGIDGVVSVPIADLLSLVSLRAVDPPPLPHRQATLVLGEARVPGCLVDGAAWGGGIAWFPRGSLGASGFAKPGAGELSAVIEYVAAPKALRDDELGPQVEIGGIGGAINLADDGSFVVTMLSEEGAAARDGRIEPGDRILAVQPIKDGPLVETKGLELETVMNLLRGRVGTPVSVRVETPGGQPRTINLVRGLIYIAERDILDRALALHARLAAGLLNGDGQPASYPSVVILVSGDMAPAIVERVDAAGVRLRSPVTDSSDRETVTIANPLIKALDLDPAASSKGIPKVQFERLLTLPRSQQADPPTHLLRLRGGDYLRGRLVSLDENEVVFDVLGQKKRLPRPSVVRLIWLHPESLEPVGDGEAAVEAAGEPTGLVVQGVAKGGQRTTLVAERMLDAAIIGRSEAFGPSRIDTKQIDRLLLGGAIAGEQEKVTWLQWKLRPAPLPRALRDEE